MPVNTDRGRKNGTAWLTGPEAHDEFTGDLASWWLCIDRVKLSDVRRYIYDRDSRIGSIAWLRTLRRVERVLQADEDTERPVRAHIREAALAAKLLPVSEIDEAIDAAVTTWRADHRGAPVPTLDDKKGLGQLMSLVFPAQSLSESMAPLIAALCEKHSLDPLMLTRTGKNQFALYTTIALPDRAAYGSGVAWGWVRRHLLKVSGNKASLGSASTVWLLDKTIEATEEIVTRWPGLDAWIHSEPEPIRLPALLRAREGVAAGSQFLEALDAARKAGKGFEDGQFAQWLLTASASARNLTYTQYFYLTVPIAIFQPVEDAAPLFVYARVNFVDLVREYGTADQLKELMNTRGFRSAQMKNRARASGPVQWRPITMTRYEPNWLLREGELGTWSKADWAYFESHKPGGFTRKDRGASAWGLGGRSGSTRAERRAEGGNPLHDTIRSSLSWNRVIDHLMGIAPLHRRAFYRSVDKRVGDIWCGIGGDRAQHEAKRKEEHDRRFEPPVRAAVELAPCLWDTAHCRSVANRYLSGKAEKESRSRHAANPVV